MSNVDSEIGSLTRTLPRRPKSHMVAATAVSLVRLAIERRGWIFRELQSDYGMDGEIEVIDSDEGVTGALLRVQIKGAPKDLERVRLKATTANYLAVSPVPVVLLIVNTSTKMIKWLLLEEQHLRLKSSSAKSVGVSLSDADPLEKSWEVVEEFALGHQQAALGILRYCQYNEAAQLIRYIDLFLNFGGDADAMVKWMRYFASDDHLTYDYGYAVQLRQRLVDDPGLLDDLRRLVISFFPNLRGRIDQRLKLRKSGKPVGKVNDVLKHEARTLASRKN